MRQKYLVGICSFNEGGKIKRVLNRFTDYNSYDVLVIDDGSSDKSLDNIEKQFPIYLIRNKTTCGAGFGTRQIIEYALGYEYDAMFFVAGNDKDEPCDIAKLKEKLDEGYDFVQGSRYLPGGRYGRMPFYRRVATQWIHPVLFSLITKKKITDSTNGFRAIRTSLCEDPRLSLNQSWLDQYELEPYLFFKAIQLGYKVIEVPVTKIYPPKEEGYTKMKPFVGWWSMLKPIIYLGLGIRK